MITSDYDHFLMKDLLRGVSRSFYLTLRVLPPALRRPLSIAYLLARASDTIADSHILHTSLRLESLESLLKSILKKGSCDLRELIIYQKNVKEKILLERIDEIIILLKNLDSKDRSLVCDVLEIIISGQRLDLLRFENASSRSIVCLEKASDLDDYTYLVAGCVGEFWTRTCFRHLTNTAPSADLIEQSIRFGKGLQLVNILRDLADDLSKGRCYLPKDEMLKKDLTIKTLAHSESQSALSCLVREYGRLACDHLEEGWKYVCALPFCWFRVRLACALPFFLGLETLSILPFDRLICEDRVKVSRAKLRQIVLRSVLVYPFPFAWKKIGRSRAKALSNVF